MTIVLRTSTGRCVDPKRKAALMTTDGSWHGTSTEWNELGEAVTNNCTCGERTDSLAPRCSAHQLLDEQRALDRLLFTRRIAARLVQEEMTEGSVPITQQ